MPLRESALSRELGLGTKMDMIQVPMTEESPYLS